MHKNRINIPKFPIFGTNTTVWILKQLRATSCEGRFFGENRVLIRQGLQPWNVVFVAFLHPGMRAFASLSPTPGLIRQGLHPCFCFVVIFCTHYTASLGNERSPRTTQG